MCRNIKDNCHYPVGILLFIFSLLAMSKWGSLPWSNIILSFTAMAVLWYTLEARRLSELSKKQIEINIRPIIVVRWDGSTLRLKNIGRSPALNISIKDIVDKDARLNFDTMPVCEFGVELGIGYKLFINGILIFPRKSGHKEELVLA